MTRTQQFCSMATTARQCEYLSGAFCACKYSSFHTGLSASRCLLLGWCVRRAVIDPLILLGTAPGGST
ncbi:MAG TPA: hypothetical protein VKH62_17635, partial [Candidatus Binatia bacterium]|nr:hypothetical protein [Candidatus Binatia bacterium]